MIWTAFRCKDTTLKADDYKFLYPLTILSISSNFWSRTRSLYWLIFCFGVFWVFIFLFREYLGLKFKFEIWNLKIILTNNYFFLILTVRPLFWNDWVLSESYRIGTLPLRWSSSGKVIEQTSFQNVQEARFLHLYAELSNL